MAETLGPCYCDLPTCTRPNSLCKQLAEYRITHRVLTTIIRRMSGWVNTESTADVLAFIEMECEILTK